MQDYSFVWNQYDMIRGMFLEGLSKTSEQEAEIVPVGFKNNIHWNIG
ncbi:DinB family protein, partial [Mesorhizobium sp. M00.F.Ca.ET.186.01.1.1]